VPLRSKLLTHSTYCTIEADRHEASRGISATAGLGLLLTNASMWMLYRLAIRLTLSRCCIMINMNNIDDDDDNNN